ncbi:hypothetical protein ZRA01_23320 [Zoogloea ramigera]|uniref:Type I-U CRISPR-associated helicase/endonuclease Cas3 n=1 Tax=Zoogloea ramigera TaxID=350 RepID=A0A4Y4CWW0_ZOORA|nr:type I-U CRISPR-associated helicase/endonuclease Cas3 [Zoogloea ramigera]GEC96259.1 hypothetical protein ZRA01_23320 [Zoogloea ramigera]
MQFEAFFQHVNEHPPFPWQRRLADRLAPGSDLAITVPTGLGKSAAIDAAIWGALAGRWRCIVFVVDRRIVVDEVHERALRIDTALQNKPELAELRDRLGPLQIVRLRGGLFGDDDWVLYPDRLSVVLSTVDQVGSRLLGRGYGVSPRRWPLHSAFFSSQTLIVVDEAHLSSPFLHTLTTLRRSGADITILPMSATLADPSPDALGLEADDHAHPLIARRLAARKLTRLIDAASDDMKFVGQALAEAITLGLGKPGRKLGVIVNRVATARLLYENLKKRGERCILLIGRSRGLDRERLLANYLPELKAGRHRSADQPALCVVATQTVEVGADFDFDAIISESASLSALRQRFGRLDRLGELGATHAVILNRKGKKTDPVYGDDGAKAWAWLNAQAAGGTIDMGLAALSTAITANPPPAEQAAAIATLLPAHLHLLAQSGPYAPEIDVAPWLHGPQPPRAEVTLVWRADLDPTTSEHWRDCVAAMPPMRAESLDMPLSAVRRWLRGEHKLDDSLCDLDHSPSNEGTPHTASGHARLALRWRGLEDSGLVTADEIQPGDTLIVPATWGGCDEWGWAPNATRPVEDLAEQCHVAPPEGRQAPAPLLRLWPERLASIDPRENLRAALLAALQARAQFDAQEDTDLRADAESALDDTLHTLREQLATSRHPWIRRLGVDFTIDTYPGGLLLRGAGITEEHGVIETGIAVPLDIHHGDVARWATALAGHHPQRNPILAAARIHDAGKREPRMQRMLHGNALAAAAGPLLAKSAQRLPADRLNAHRESGLPRGFRHELASLAYEAPSAPLVRYLVGSHHGYGRPWFVPCVDSTADGAAIAALGSGWLALYARLLNEHGPWQLARCEWLLRTADARASIEEAAGDNA